MMKKIINQNAINNYSGNYIILMIFILITFLLLNSSQISSFSMLEIAPKGFVYQPSLLEEISADTAVKAIEQAKLDIEEMKKFNFMVVFPTDALQEAETSYANGDYETVIKLTQLIAYVKTEKIEFFDRIKLIEIKKQALKEKGIDVAEVDTLMQQAMNSFNLEQIDQAKVFLNSADQKADELSREHLRVQLILTLSKNFFVRYWWQSILVFIFLSITVSITVKQILKSKLKRKIARLNLDLKETTELIKKLQKECFVERKITPQTYKERAEKYEEIITEIKHTLPILEAQLKEKKKKKK